MEGTLAELGSKSISEPRLRFSRARPETDAPWELTVHPRFPEQGDDHPRRQLPPKTIKIIVLVIDNRMVSDFLLANQSHC